MHLMQLLEFEMHFEMCKANADVWLRKAAKPDGSEYYKLLLVYTDDVLIVLHQPREAMMQLDQNFLVKKDSIEKPKTYLGALIGEYTFPKDSQKRYWVMGSDNYLKDAVRQVKE